MAATLTLAAAAGGDRWLVAGIGDSPAWLVTARCITRVTDDDNAAAELVRAGVISADEARTHPGRHWITRALGATTGPGRRRGARRHPGGARAGRGPGPGVRRPGARAGPGDRPGRPVRRRARTTPPGWLVDAAVAARAPTTSRWPWPGRPAGDDDPGAASTGPVDRQLRAGPRRAHRPGAGERHPRRPPAGRRALDGVQVPGRIRWDGTRWTTLNVSARPGLMTVYEPGYEEVPLEPGRRWAPVRHRWSYALGRPDHRFHVVCVTGDHLGPAGLTPAADGDDDEPTAGFDATVALAFTPLERDVIAAYYDDFARLPRPATLEPRSTTRPPAAWAGRGTRPARPSSGSTTRSPPPTTPRPSPPAATCPPRSAGGWPAPAPSTRTWCTRSNPQVTA